MIRIRPLLVLALVAAAALACAHRESVSKSQCTAGDWETIGYRDGALGHRSSRILAHQDACVPHGITPDRAAYLVGWNQGVEEFCTPRNGFDLGERGRGHDNVCPAALRDGFLAAYDQGRSLWVARTRVAELEQVLAQKVGRLETIDADIAATVTAQLDPLLVPAQRVQLAARVKQLYDEKTRLRDEIPQLEAELRTQQSELDTLDRALASATR
ncbi:MAG: DUF2799 domain-containing protein [Myxococcota bacterium]